MAIVLYLWIGRDLEHKNREWSTVCQGEGRVYRLRSTDMPRVPLGIRHSGGNRDRALHFLGVDGKTRYYTKRYVWRSRLEHGVWRFRYNPKDTRFFGIKDQAAVLHGDEQLFEIALALDHMLVARKEAPPLRLPCVPKKQYEAGGAG